MKNKISVVLCTYNGGKFLSEQLQSIIDQTRLPDEIVICDDCSTDNTIQVIREFICKEPDLIQLSQNQTQLGYIKNFESGIRLATGDIIFLSDQDDVWDKRKIEIFEQTFDANKKAGLVFSNADVVNEHLDNLHYSLWEYVKLIPETFTTYSREQLLQYLIKEPRITGATLAFRGKNKNQLLPFSSYIGHDEWLALNMASIAYIVPINQKLVKYRQHAHNQIGAIKDKKYSKVKGRQAKEQKERTLISSLYFHYRKLKGYIDFYKHVKNLGIPLAKEIMLNQYNKVMHHRNRLKAYRIGIVGYWLLLKELSTLRYFKYSNGLRGFISDLIHI